ncbi:MAG: 50S ribosomal protein L25 [Chloroflexi bacterium]|nr:50S ribosomal protein L25 [Chloroflexota bacterium]
MDLELTLDAREAQGKANKRLRREGFVPGVVYGKGEDSTNVQVEAKTFEVLYRAAGKTSVVKFRLPGASRATSGFIKSVQRHPLSGRPLHVDYYLVNLKVEMEVDVPLVFTGEAPAVEATGGTLLHNMSSIHVKALPTDIPHEIVVDVSVLKSLDVAIHVRDLNLNRDLVNVMTDGETLVATVVPPRVEEEPEPVVAEGEEGEEGEGEGEGAEGGATEGEGGAEPSEESSES